MAVMEGDRGLRLLGRKLGRNWLPVLVVSMLAIVAVSELHTPYMPAVLWFCAIIAILAVRERPVAPKTDETAVAETDEPEVPAESVISGVRAGLAVLDTPVFILDKNASVLFQNGAAERAFGQLPPGAHISARLRSPGLLDVIR